MQTQSGLLSRLPYKKEAFQGRRPGKLTSLRQNAHGARSPRISPGIRRERIKEGGNVSMITLISTRCPFWGGTPWRAGRDHRVQPGSATSQANLQGEKEERRGEAWGRGPKRPEKDKGHVHRPWPSAHSLGLWCLPGMLPGLCP